MPTAKQPTGSTPGTPGTPGIPQSHRLTFQRALHVIWSQESQKYALDRLGVPRPTDDKALGTTRQVALMQCTLNGKLTTCMCEVVPERDKHGKVHMVQMYPMYVTVTDDMDLKNLDGQEPVPLTKVYEDDYERGPIPYPAKSLDPAKSPDDDDEKEKP